MTEGPPPHLCVPVTAQGARAKKPAAKPTKMETMPSSEGNEGADAGMDAGAGEVRVDCWGSRSCLLAR